MKWRFPPNNYGPINGIGDAGIETFLGTPLKSLAREICQNSLDATKEKTVIIEFSSFNVRREKFYGVDELEKVFKNIIDYWQTQRQDKTRDFFKKALEIINGETIPFLRISDFNTTGLTGSKIENNTPWTDLTKSAGSSDKGDGAGGSFGIGKFAPFACSALRTVFYSTYDIENICASQGVSKLVSFNNGKGETTQGTGYYGDERNTPVYELLEFDERHKRTKTGTDIYIAGFTFPEEKWKKDIIISTIDGFIGAIWDEKLIVYVENIEISKKTLPKLINEYKELFAENADNYYQVLTSEETKWFTQDYKNMGIIELGLVINQGMHRKVAMIRKTGMKIMDKDKISGAIPFAGVMNIKGDKLNTYLKNLENPQHTKWELERASDQAQAKEILNGLTAFIKECLDKIKVDDSKEELDAEGIGEYLPDENTGDEEKKTDLETISDRISTIEKGNVKRRATVRKVITNEITNEEQELINLENGEDIIENVDLIWHKLNNGGGGGTRPPDDVISGNEAYEVKKQIVKVGAQKARIVCLNRKNGEYSIIFTPKTSVTEAYLELYLVAESGNYKADILWAAIIGKSEIETEGNKIKLDKLNAEETIRIKLKINYQDYCSMEVDAYGVKA